MRKNIALATMMLCTGAFTLSALAQEQADPTIEEAPPSDLSVTNTATPSLQLEDTERNLSLVDCVQIGLEHNLDIQITRIDPEISEYSYSMAYAGYDPTLTASYQYGFNKNPSSVDPGTTILNLSRDIYRDNLSGGLSMLTPIGGTVNFTGNYGRSGYSSGLYNSGNEDQFTASGGVSFTQPLLKNLWIDSTRMGSKVAKKNLHVSQMTYAYGLKTTIFSIEQAYFNLIGARENIIAAEQNLLQAENFLAETRKKVELGSLIELDTKDAESQVSAAKSSLISMRQNYNTAANTLKQLLSDDFTLWQDASLNLTDELLSVPTFPSRAESWYKGMTLRPDLLQTKVNLEISDINLKYSYNQLFPQLDLIGSYTHNGAELNNGAGALTQMSQGTYPGYTVGAQLSVPLGNITARNTYKTRKAERQQQLLQLKQKEQSVMIEIDNAINDVRSSIDAVKASRDASKYAEEAWLAGKIRLENGKATSFEVLQLQTTLFQRHLEEINSLVTYNINLANLCYMEGGTLEKYNITVNYE